MPRWTPKQRTRSDCSHSSDPSLQNGYSSIVPRWPSTIPKTTLFGSSKLIDRLQGPIPTSHLGLCDVGGDVDTADRWGHSRTQGHRSKALVRDNKALVVHRLLAAAQPQPEER